MPQPKDSQEPQLFTLPEEVQAKRPLVAFGRFVKPQMYDVFGEYQLEGVTESEKEWMLAANIAPRLFNPNGVYNEDDQGRELAVDNVAFNAYEYNLVVRSPKHLGRFATARTLKDKDIDEEVLAAGERAADHALLQKYEAMVTHKAKLQEQRSLLKELHKEAHAPGFAHKTEEKMKQLTSAAWNEFTTILDVLHVQRGWDDQKRQRAEAAMIATLTQGSQRDRVKNWKSLIELAGSYLGARIHIFTSRIESVDQRLSE